MLPQPSAIGTRIYIALWLVVYLAPVVGWLVASLVVAAFGKRGLGNPLRRAAFHAGEMALGLFGVVVLLRVVLWAVFGITGGPMAWVGQLARTVPWLQHWAPTLQDVSLLYAAVPLGLVTLVGTPVLALVGCVRRDPPPARVPLGLPVAAALVAAALAVPFLARFAWRHADADIWALDLFLTLPMAALGLAIWTAAARRGPPERAARPAMTCAADLPPIDIPATWRRLGALDPDIAPIHAAATSTAGGDPRASTAWRDAGGHGPAPVALEHIATAAADPGAGWLVGDLDDHTERAFLVAALLLLLRDRGLTALVVTDTPDPFRDDVATSLARSGSWECGPLVAGQEELRAALAGGRLPAAAFLDVRGLSSEGIRALAGGRDDASVAWSQAVGVVVTSRVDRGTPLDVTHRLLTLRRLGLALRASAARWSVLATGVGGAGTRQLVEQAFVGTPVTEVPFGPRATASIDVWLARDPFVRAPAEHPWVRRALAPVAATGRAVSVSDPAGRFDTASVSLWGRDVALVRGPALYGAASAGTLSEAWLVAGFRTLGNRPPDSNGEGHHALWAVAHSPVARFLTAPGALENLAKRGRLEPPRPLVGYGNKLVTRAHLHAAIREGRQDVDSLEALFGRSLVEQVLRGHDAAPAWVMRPDPRGELRRVRVAPVPPDVAADPVRGTVTDQVVRVVDRHGGGVLGEVDRALAPTRYYPKRVFAVGDRRYQVELHRYDDGRAEILVEQVAAGEAITHPILAFEVDAPRSTESRHTVTQDGFAFELAGYEATVTESVTGAIGETGKTVTYDAVRARYRTRVRAITFRRDASPTVLHHLARSLQDVLVAHLLGTQDDFDVAALPAGFAESPHPTLVIVDRHVQGIGVQEAIDDLVAVDVLTWVRAILSSCGCSLGCPRCTPADVVARGPDKVGVLRLLGG